ncbi:MAG: Crp/Fnr family transcriptional regulator [Flavobacteriaceae bacterium]|nr:Crp/Fnr family transcriptional regulator [Flavobacteriaceae bacterium]
MIPLHILEQYPITQKSYSKNTIVFNEGENAKFYFQVNTGEIKMFNLNDDGKEFAQGFFKAGKSFGEPPLFGNFNYPASAICIEDSELYILPKSSFFNLLKTHPEVHLKFTKTLCNRMLYKSKIMQEISIHPPEHRILTLLNYFKNLSGHDGLYEVKMTRQQISDLTGLRVETVIRTIKQLEKLKKLKLKQHKVYL